ncbi:HAMP domain-containing sensor histidine kinase [Chondromyces crocatus]|uniref:histidine kinase n=1 Tax=Chondromyces crocatus TaxID=52 RepID=A0A0K1EFM8_CHOCO|nr:HAMP domain-containing sensor histidine kinase [Chondromyces crocatus]AKT39671.1 histidine kinase [Chondromyces crocatus]
MRLLTRLVLSHAVLVLVMLGALAVVLGSLAGITSSLQELLGGETVSLRREATLHRAAWAVELAMRHGDDACAQGVPWDDVGAKITHRLAALDAELGEPARPTGGTMLAAIDGYRRLARRVVAEGTCAGLVAPASQTERERLDEQLTDAWIQRIFELHDAVRAKEEDARSAGASALSSGFAIALAACVLAAVLAHQLARTVTEPLAALGTQAQRLGKGDFDAGAEQVAGPAEVRDLGHEIEIMRRRLAELDTLKQGFLASVSHELRTPLTKIREAIALLQDGVGGGTLTERQTRILHIARVACEREIRMVTTLLDLSRLSAGTPIRLQAGSAIDDLVRNAVRDEDEEAREHGVVVDVEAPGEVPLCSLDVALVERAVANLVRNAISVSKAGQRVLVRRELVSGEGSPGPGPWVKISVSDQGPGVPPEIRQAIFDEFMTHSVTNSPKRVGVGLGLALSRQIARAHRGELELDGLSVGTGATFRLWLPIAAELSTADVSDALQPAPALS